MRKYYFIAAGGAVGALLRFKLKTAPNLFLSSDLLLNFSYNILLINLFGCLLLGILNAIFSKTDRISDDVKLGVTAGFVGAFTTFSTFCKESMTILDTGFISAFCYYVGASLILGVVAVSIGHVIGHRILHPIGQNIVSRFGYDYN
ncbi:fluoride efflux transporter FluC [Acetobacterium woodii]|uniref:Fluoride-specific ion channel FluC n=1 Tax=Acetobacterium woodii (strain ATCC 29683 / DSM 1030 / JCM 2381 / KCTC 1655 / WB1) TaxID=931626 RepID=H6LFI8_ACEWD|nr:CrcB family protein [Acetobacterium woodii]AFA49475.1 camphor resistance protein CrcB1 [Acetobacterium woodii DSM 1030]